MALELVNSKAGMVEARRAAGYHAARCWPRGTPFAADGCD